MREADDNTVFASPPWGGPGYTSDHIFDLDTMEPYNLDDLTKLISDPFYVRAALFLPRTSDMRQLARLSRDEKRTGEGRAAREMGKLDAVQYCMYGASKAVCVYIPGREDCERWEEMAEAGEGEGEMEDVGGRGEEQEGEVRELGEIEWDERGREGTQMKRRKKQKNRR
jgi:hypothetical protein